ncbi:hypothetical protein EJ05DRAFT_499461 [Pseudovirgaria hyperparasitica]|uniref:Apple domain-containing protein n=1 Tax=Pseudovirgaria hyperparasitica TaxID=470096 RepID=A0A6A6WBR0_9PEZI|nr:uncharacterized protein EJ05DRAFT_499461 [Pseudovirgaria hyperparasitica]KAF2759037.1 hypothetical protein EJ05DRAFT_499461 [Pseudovirgaria hyperparasitica]
MQIKSISLLALPLIVLSTAVDIEARAQTCAQPGWNLATRAYFYERNERLSTPAQCGSHCLGDTRCVSYAVGNKVCMHFAATRKELQERPSKPVHVL